MPLAFHPWSSHTTSQHVPANALKPADAHYPHPKTPHSEACFPFGETCLPLCIFGALDRSLDHWFLLNDPGTLDDSHPISSQILWSLSLTPGILVWWGKGLYNKVFKHKWGATCCPQLGKTFDWRFQLKNTHPGTSLVVQRLRLLASKAESLSSIPDQGTRSHMLQLEFTCLS